MSFVYWLYTTQLVRFQGRASGAWLMLLILAGCHSDFLQLSFGSSCSEAVISTSGLNAPVISYQNSGTAASPSAKIHTHPSPYGPSTSIRSKSSSLQKQQNQSSETSSLSSSGCGGLADSGRGGSLSLAPSTNGGGTGSTASSTASGGRRDPSTTSGLTWSKTGVTGNDSSLLDSDEEDDEEEEEEDDFESSSHEVRHYMCGID